LYLPSAGGRHTAGISAFEPYRRFGIAGTPGQFPGRFTRLSVWRCHLSACSSPVPSLKNFELFRTPFTLLPHENNRHRVFCLLHHTFLA